MDRKLIGKCGKFCGVCRIYVAAHGGGPEARAELAAELDVDAARIACEGCQGLTPSCYGYGCKIIACLEERGYRYCVQCAEINDCTKFARVNVEFGGQPKIQSSQLRAWGEERWLKYYEGRAAPEAREEAGSADED